MGKIRLTIKHEGATHAMEMAQGESFEVRPHIPIQGFLIEVLQAEEQKIFLTMKDLPQLSLDDLLTIQKIITDSIQEKITELQESLDD